MNTTAKIPLNLWTLLGLGALLVECGSASRDPNPFRSYENGCTVEEAFACSDTAIRVTAEGSFTKRITTWRPAERKFLDVLSTREGVVADRSFLHYYDADMRDSIIYWVESVDTDTIAFKGWTAYHYYPTGSRALVVLYNEAGVAYDSTHYYPDGTLRVPCRPLADGPCSETFTSVEGHGDTVRELSWDAEQRRFTELAFAAGSLLPQRSFVHLYGRLGRDSIVYWVASRDRKGELTYSGWGTYHYDQQGRLTRIDNYDAADGARYGYIRYDTTGRVREQMADGYVWTSN